MKPCRPGEELATFRALLSDAPKQPRRVSRFSPARFRMLNLLFFFSGAIALVYEVIWQRKFSLLFGSSAPATAAVLVSYFAGLGLGSYVIGKSAHRCTSPLRVYGWLEVL